MEEMEMEVDVGSINEASPSSSKNLKKLGLKNAIQTNFGEDYVFQIASRYFFAVRFILRHVRLK